MLITCIDRLLRIVKEQPITLETVSRLAPHQERLANHFSKQSHSNTGIGGGERDRTDDPLLAKQVLSQLSYTPIVRTVVGLDGFEPSTPALSRRCSNQLSYRPAFFDVALV